jgi:hypothetical protein
MNMKRMRGRNHRPNGGGGGGGGGFRNQQNGIPLNRNHVFDSSGPEMRVRGTAQQLYDKYQQLARDAFSNGDRVTGEAYYQHAEHYFRIIAAINQAQGLQNPQGGQPHQGQERGFGGQGGGHGGGEHRREPQGDLLESGEARPQHESRPQHEFRGENRDNREQRENRRFDPRQRPDRPERNEPRFRPENVVDPRIDISMALEAELAAASAEPAGLGEQPSLPGTLSAPQPAPEAAPRAIPIVRNAPPAEEAPAPLPSAEAAPEPAPAPRTPRPRGRPRMARPEAEAAKAEE